MKKRKKVIIFSISICLLLILLYTIFEIFNTLYQHANVLSPLVNESLDNFSEADYVLFMFNGFNTRFAMIINCIVPILTLSCTIFYTVSYTERNEKRRSVAEAKPFLNIHAKYQRDGLDASITNVGNKTALNIRILNRVNQEIRLLNGLMNGEVANSREFISTMSKEYFTDDLKIIILYEDLLGNTYEQQFTSLTDVMNRKSTEEINIFLLPNEPTIRKWNITYKS